MESIKRLQVYEKAVQYLYDLHPAKVGYLSSGICTALSKSCDEDMVFGSYDEMIKKYFPEVYAKKPANASRISWFEWNNTGRMHRIALMENVIHEMRKKSVQDDIPCSRD